MLKRLRSIFPISKYITILIIIFAIGLLLPSATMAQGNHNIVAAIDHNWVDSENWANGVTVSLTIEDAGDVIHIDSQTAQPREEEPNVIQAWFDVDIDLIAGYVITLTDGTETVVYTVEDISFSSMDVESDIARGTAPPKSLVNVSAFDATISFTLPTLTDENGDWVADFNSAPFDVTSEMSVDVNLTDENGDSTVAHLLPIEKSNNTPLLTGAVLLVLIVVGFFFRRKKDSVATEIL